MADDRVRDEAYRQLRSISKELGHAPSMKEFEAHDRTNIAAKKIARMHGGSWAAACRAAGVQEAGRSRSSAGKLLKTKTTVTEPVISNLGDDQLLDYGVAIAAELGYLPGWSDWVKAREAQPELPSEWQVYRRFGGGKDAWRLFHYLLFERCVANKIALPGEYIE